MIRFVVYLLHFSSLSCFCFVSSGCVLNDEGQALLKIKQRIGGDSLSSWKCDDRTTNDPCTWMGVECSSDGRVIALSLRDHCLEGTLAPEIGNLIHLKSIVLRNNSFTGHIPKVISNLNALEVLDLGYNNFKGPLPPDFGNNLSLTTFLVDNNPFLGNLSPQLLNLKTISEHQSDDSQLYDPAKGLSCAERIATRNARTFESQYAGQRQLLNSNSSKKSGHPSKQKENTISLPPSPSPSLSPSPSPSSLPSSPSSLPSSPSPSPISSQSRSSNHSTAVILGVIGGTCFLLISAVGAYCYIISKATVNPWTTGLSGQLQKAFTTGIPKLKRSELDSGCEDFSNVIGSSAIGTMYKGTLSNGVEIAVASVTITSSQEWSENLEIQFRNKIETLSKLNHKNFVNLIGYCIDNKPFTRMMVFEYASNGSLFDHLHVTESEHLNWQMRLRITVGMAYCLEHMHKLNPPMTHNNLTSSSVYLMEDFAVKISDFSFSYQKDFKTTENQAPVPAPEANVYNFGVLLFEVITGRLPFSVDSTIGDWASDYLKCDKPVQDMVDPTLESFDEENLVSLWDLMRSCVHPDPHQRPLMNNIAATLRDITRITPDAASPKLSPMWWAELEIMSPPPS